MGGGVVLKLIVDLHLSLRYVLRCSQSVVSTIELLTNNRYGKLDDKLDFK